MGTILKKVYGKQADFVAFTKLLGEVRLQSGIDNQQVTYFL